MEIAVGNIYAVGLINRRTAKTAGGNAMRIKLVFVSLFFALSVFCMPKSVAGDADRPSISFFDDADCSSLAGWACDPDDYAAAMQVHFYADGPAGTGSFVGATTANLVREAAVGDLCGGKNNHGYAFSTPASLKDGRKHTIYVYAINTPAGNNPQLTDSPKTIVCSSSCVPNCVGKTRGDDGCGGNCGAAESKIAGGGGGGGGDGSGGMIANVPEKMTRAEILQKIAQIKQLLV